MRKAMGLILLLAAVPAFASGRAGSVMTGAGTGNSAISSGSTSVSGGTNLGVFYKSGGVITNGTGLTYDGSGNLTAAGTLSSNFVTLQVNGSQAAPSLSWASGYGIFSPLGNSIAVAINGVAVATWTASGFTVGNTSTANDSVVTLNTDASVPAATSLFIIHDNSSVTVSQSTNSLGINSLYSDLNGNNLWGMHIHMPSSSHGNQGYVAGVHGYDDAGFETVVDSTDGFAIRGWQQTSTDVQDWLRFEAETVWTSDMHAGGTPTFAGTFSGKFLNYLKRNVSLFNVDSTGAMSSCDSTGVNCLKMQDNGSQAALVCAHTLAVAPTTGATWFYAPNLATATNFTMANGGALTVAPVTSGTLAFSGFTTKTFQAGSGTGTYEPSGLLDALIVSSGTDNTTNENTLYTYTLPANTFVSTATINRQAVHITAGGATAVAATSMRIRIYYGATTILDTGAVGLGTANWYADCNVVQRTTGASQQAVCHFSSGAGTITTNNSAATETISGTSIIKITGTDTAGSANGTTCTEALVEKK